VIPAAFDYAAPGSVEEALGLLAGAEDAKIMAGGQSLLAVLKLRLAAPGLVIDLGKIDALRGVREDGDAIVIGALTTHHDVATDPLVAAHARLISQAAATIADPQVRHRGTFGGALAHADPAGDLPAPVLALDAEFVILSSQGRETVSAADFFEDLFTTALGEDKILLEVRVPKKTGWGAAYEKFVRVAHQWAIVAVAACVRTEGGRIAEARIGLTNMGPVPIRPTAVERALVGCTVDEAAIQGAVATVADGTNPPSDINADADYRRHLATVLTRRAVLAATQEG